MISWDGSSVPARYQNNVSAVHQYSGKETALWSFRILKDQKLTGLSLFQHTGSEAGITGQFQPSASVIQACPASFCPVNSEMHLLMAAKLSALISCSIRQASSAATSGFTPRLMSQPEIREWRS